MAARVGAVIVGIVTAAVVINGLQGIDSARTAYAASTPVLLATVDLAIGDRLTEAAVRTEHLPARAVPADALGTLSDVGGTVVRSPVLAGAVVTKRHVTDASVLVPPGTRAVALESRGDLTIGAGAVVDVVGTGDAFSTPIVIRGAVVVAVGTTGQFDDTRSVTVLVSAGDLEEVARLIVGGPVLLALTPDG